MSLLSRVSIRGISARSAFVSATVVLVALALAGAGLAFVIYRLLLADVDDAAVSRMHDIAVALQNGPDEDLDPALLATDQGLVAIQVITPDGVVAARSQSAPETPLAPMADIGDGLHIGMPYSTTTFGPIRLTAQTLDGAGGRYTVLVAEGSEVVESTVKTVIIALAVAGPIVIAVSAAATYRLVRRSLRSVDEIRSRVSEITTSDLTERVPVPDSGDEIAALAITMNEMLARIEAGHTAQRRFVSDASHELRSPLTTIISALEMVAAHPELLDENLAAGTLMPEAHRMRSLVEDLLLLARADERGLTLRSDDVDLDDLASGEVERIRRETPLQVRADLAPTRLVGDAGSLARALRNLMDNAARHAASRIDIEVRSVAGTATVRIADDGPGIPEADRARVFDRFVRLDSDRSRSAGGTGLGLAIVAEIIVAHHGRVSIGDRPEGGTVVLVQLPLTPSPDSSR